MGQARAVKSIARAAGALLLSPRGWIHPLAGLCGEGSRWLSSPIRQLTKAEGIHFPLPIPPLSTPLCSGRSKVRAWWGRQFGGQQRPCWAQWGSTMSPPCFWLFLMGEMLEHLWAWLDFSVGARLLLSQRLSSDLVFGVVIW